MWQKLTLTLLLIIAALRFHQLQGYRELEERPARFVGVTLVEDSSSDTVPTGFAHRAALVRPDVRTNDGLTVERYIAAEAQVVVDLGEPPTPLVEPRLTGSISGNVVDSTGLPVAAMNLVVYSDGADIRSAKVETDAGGWFVAEQVTAGPVTLAIAAPAYVPVHTLALDVGDWAYAQVVLDPRWHSIRGEVRDMAGAPLGDIVLHILTAGAPPPGMTGGWIRTDRDGTFQFSSPIVPPYDVEIIAATYTAVVRRIESRHDFLEVYLAASI